MLLLEDAFCVETYAEVEDNVFASQISTRLTFRRTSKKSSLENRHAPFLRHIHTLRHRYAMTVLELLLFCANQWFRLHLLCILEGNNNNIFKSKSLDTE